MIVFIQVKFAGSTDVWARGHVCPAARDGVKSQLLCGILVWHRPCQGHNHPSRLLNTVWSRPEERLWERKFFSAQSHASARELPSNKHIAAAEFHSADSFGLKRPPSVKIFPICFWVLSRWRGDMGESHITHRTVLASLLQLAEIFKVIETILKWTNKWKEYTFELSYRWDRKQKCSSEMPHYIQSHLRTGNQPVASSLSAKRVHSSC